MQSLNLSPTASAVFKVIDAVSMGAISSAIDGYTHDEIKRLKIRLAEITQLISSDKESLSAMLSLAQQGKNDKLSELMMQNPAGEAMKQLMNEYQQNATKVKAYQNTLDDLGKQEARLATAQNTLDAQTGIDTYGTQAEKDRGAVNEAINLTKQWRDTNVRQ